MRTFISIIEVLLTGIKIGSAAWGVLAAIWMVGLPIRFLFGPYTGDEVRGGAVFLGFIFGPIFILLGVGGYNLSTRALKWIRSRKESLSDYDGLPDSGIILRHTQDERDSHMAHGNETTMTERLVALGRNYERATTWLVGSVPSKHRQIVFITVVIIVSLLLVVMARTVSKPAYWPTPEDFRLATVSNSNPLLLLMGADAETVRFRTFDMYASVYVVTECLNGKERTPEGFQDFVEKTYFKGQYGAVVTELARWSLHEMRDIAQERIARGQSPVKEECMRPFMYPESRADAAWSRGLILAATTYPILTAMSNGDGNISLYEIIASGVNGTISSWLDQEGRGGKPLILWYCQNQPESCERLDLQGS